MRFLTKEQPKTVGQTVTRGIVVKMEYPSIKARLRDWLRRVWH